MKLYHTCHHTMPLVEYVVDVVVKEVGDFSSLHSGKLAFQLPTQLRVRERPFIRGSSFATALTEAYTRCWVGS